MCRRKVCDVGSQMWTRVCPGRRRHREPRTSDLGQGTTCVGDAERSKEQAEAAARAAHRDGETPEDTKWSSSHRADPQDRRSCPDLGDRREQLLLRPTFSPCLEPGHPVRMEKAARNLMPFAPRRFVFLPAGCMSPFSSPG